MNVLEKRIIDISFRHKLTHVSSCLGTVNLIADIYSQRKDNEPFVLGNSHAALALFVVLERHGKCDAEAMAVKHGTHATRDIDNGVYVTGGSLGQPDTIAVGLALADRTRRVWLVTSDGACCEGAVHEVGRFKRAAHLHNLVVWVVYNGFGAYRRIGTNEIPDGFRLHASQTRHWPEWLRGIDGHYLKLSPEQYEQLMSDESN